ncbi:MAG: sulfate adenylyltransferase subunit CysD [Parcubacteria group bacterium]|jgi:sulfate adenylyltransferase subunit 2
MKEYLKHKEEKSIHIIREAFEFFERAGLLWSLGKDSAVLLHLVKKAFLGKVPFPVMHIDTGFEFEKLVAWRDKTAKKMKLDLKIIKPDPPRLEMLADKVAFYHHHKTLPFLKFVKKNNLKAAYAGIRSDEHGIRAKEHYFSLRNPEGKLDFDQQPISVWDFYPHEAPEGCHFRIHPLLHWNEADIWEYIEQEKVPIPDLYFAKNGYRYRSLDCEPCCQPIKSKAKNIQEIIHEIKNSSDYERQGRDQDKEDPHAMEKLRALGYM